jgi:hypothetical protein
LTNSYTYNQNNKTYPYEKITYSGLIEKEFNSTLKHGISQLRFYCKPLTINEIRNNLYIDNEKFNLSLDCGRVINKPNKPNYHSNNLDIFTPYYSPFSFISFIKDNNDEYINMSGYTVTMNIYDGDNIIIEPEFFATPLTSMGKIEFYLSTNDVLTLLAEYNYTYEIILTNNDTNESILLLYGNFFIYGNLVNNIDIIIPNNLPFTFILYVDRILDETYDVKFKIFKNYLFVYELTIDNGKIQINNNKIELLDMDLTNILEYNENYTYYLELIPQNESPIRLINGNFNII